MHIVYFFKKVLKIVFQFFLSRELSSSGYHWFMSAEAEPFFFFFLKNRYESLDPLLRLKNRSIMSASILMCGILEHDVFT